MRPWPIHTRHLLLALTAGVLAVGLSMLPTQAQEPAALSGQVSSAAVRALRPHKPGVAVILWVP